MAHQAPHAAGSGIPKATTTPPAIGQHWAEANGIYIGPVAHPDGRIVGLAWANDIADLPRQPWGEYGQEVEGARSRHDGRANTLAMAAAGCAIAKQVLDLDATAWIPSQIEALQMVATLDQQHKPSGAIWTSTQYSSVSAFIQSFELGLSRWNGKGNAYRVRAVRGFILHHLTTSTLGAAPAAPDVVGQMLWTLESSREVLACALRSAAPGMFATEADIASHLHIQRIDAAIKAARQGGAA